MQTLSRLLPALACSARSSMIVACFALAGCGGPAMYVPTAHPNSPEYKASSTDWYRRTYGGGARPTYSSNNYATGRSAGSTAGNVSSQLRQSAIELVESIARSNEAMMGQQSDARLIEVATRTVADGLKDPGAAQFRRVSVKEITSGRVVCGEVNGKNSYGGYVGFRMFVAGVAAFHIESTGSKYPSIDSDANAGLDMACR